MIRATEQVALKIQIAKIRVDFLTFSAVLGITRTSSVLHSLARKFLDIFGGARHNPNKFGSALACTKIREIRGQKTLWAKNFVGKIIRGKKFRS